MSVAEISEHYGNKVYQVLFKHQEPTIEQLDTAVNLQMIIDRISCEKYLYDPFTKEKVPYGAFKNKYGDVTASNANNGGHYDQLELDHMKERHLKYQPKKIHKQKEAPLHVDNHKEVKKKPKAVAQIQPMIGDRYFLKTNRGLVRNPEYRQLFKNKGFSVVYEYLWALIVRKGWKDKPGYPIKEKYYDNGLLAFCSSYRFLARECGMDKNYIKKMIHELDKVGVIKLEMIVPEGKKHSQIVAVLGQWKAVGETVEETLYRDRIFMPKK